MGLSSLHGTREEVTEATGLKAYRPFGLLFTLRGSKEPGSPHPFWRRASYHSNCTKEAMILLFAFWVLSYRSSVLTSFIQPASHARQPAVALV